MAYKVELPPDLTREHLRVSLPKKTGDSGDIRITEGAIIAVKIASEVLSADIWLAFKDDFKRDDGEPLAVFYADEIPILAQKTLDQLQEIHKVKLAFGPGSRMRQ